MSTAVAEPLTETNPNRPTKPDHCYNCGSTGACKGYRERRLGGGPNWDECVQHPRPVTLKQHAADERYTAVEAMTSSQRAAVLKLLAVLVPEDFDFAVVRRS